MAAPSPPNVSPPASEEEFHSLSGHEPSDGEDDASTTSDALEPPVHPVPSMQGAFEESILESGQDDPSPNRTSLHLDAEGRRQRLLESKRYDETWNARWRQPPTSQHHPLSKLLAQIVFGMHLLQQQQAKSEEEVVRILQTHVNEVDRFLERTGEDFSLAIRDIADRLRFLHLPLTHLDVFDAMLDDKKFRTQLLAGNDKIERIIDRTAKAMNAALVDVRKGFDAVAELAKYLDRVRDAWPQTHRAIADVYTAMRGNEQGWSTYLKALQAQARELAASLVQLGRTIGEMSRLAAAASRRNKAQSKAVVASSHSTPKSAPASPSALRSKFATEPAPPPPPSAHKVSRHIPASSLDKPLPQEPSTNDAKPSPVPRQSLDATKPHPIPFADRYERPRESPRFPASHGPVRSSSLDTPDPTIRPRTADAATSRRSRKYEPRAADERASVAALAEFLRLNMAQPGRDGTGVGEGSGLDKAHLAPSMNPSATPRIARKPVRSQSQGVNVMLDESAAMGDGGGARDGARAMSLDGRDHGPLLSESIVAGEGLTSIREAEKPSVRVPTGTPARADSTMESSASSITKSNFARRLSKRIRTLHVPLASIPSPISSPRLPPPSTEEIESWRKPSTDGEREKKKEETKDTSAGVVATGTGVGPQPQSPQRSPPTDSVYGSRGSTEKLRPPPYEPAAMDRKAISLFPTGRSGAKVHAPVNSMTTSTTTTTTMTSSASPARNFGEKKAAGRVDDLRNDVSGFAPTSGHPARSLSSSAGGGGLSGGRRMGSVKRFFHSRSLTKIFA